MSKILITGGCGFIGSNLAKRLSAQGCDLTILDNLSTGKQENLPDGVNLIVDDVANIADYSQLISETDCIYHLAAVASVVESQEQLIPSHRTNLASYVSILDCCSKFNRNAKIVFTSSAAVYGENQSIPLGEESKTVPISSYGADKLCSEIHSRVMSDIYDLTITVFRLFNVYGPGQRASSPYSGVISKFVRNAVAGKNIQVHGSGKQSRDFVFIADVVTALVLGKERLEKFGIFNVCTGKSERIIDLARAVADLSASDANVVFTPALVGDIAHSLGDPKLCKNQLGFTASVSICEGLEKTFSWMQQNTKTK